MHLFCILIGHSLVFYATFQISSVTAGSTRLTKRFSKEDICPISETTLKIVDSCPTDNETIQERSLKKSCQKYGLCQEDPLVYHCVRYENSLAEVCAPKGLITGQCCVEFIKEVGRVAEDYKTPCPECPFHYQSNGSLKYSTCSKPITDLGKPCNGQEKGRVKRSAKCNTNADTYESIGKDNLSKRQVENDTILYITVPVAVLTFLIGSLLVYIKYRKAVAKKDSGQTPPEKLTRTENESQGLI